MIVVNNFQKAITNTFLFVFQDPLKDTSDLYGSCDSLPGYGEVRVSMSVDESKIKTTQTRSFKTNYNILQD